MAGLLSRREFVKAAVVAASGAALGIGALSNLLPAVAPAARDPKAIVLRDRNTNAVTPLTLQALEGPAPSHVVGEWGFLPAIVLKVPKSTLAASSKARGYNTAQYAVQHPTEESMAILAYEGKCTHLGCTVGFNTGLGASKDILDYDDPLQRDGRILCPCHQAQFDIYDLAKNVPGTPGPRPLPVLEVGLGDFVDGWPSLMAYRKVPQDVYRQADEQGLGQPFRLNHPGA